MAVVNTKAANLTDLDANPPVHPDVTVNGARQRAIVDTVALAAADDDNSVYRLARVHSSWIIPSIRLFNDTITAGTDFNLGLYEVDTGAAVAESAYADAISLATASTVGVEVAYENRDINKIQQRVWQDAGLTADPNKYYDLCLKGITVGSAAGDVSVIVTYLTD